MSPARVGVIGAGMAGPVLAVYLKLKGYDPVIYERTNSISDAGLGIGIQRNGLRVLSGVPGLLEHINAHQIDSWEAYSVVEEDPGLLGTSDHPKKFRESGGFGVVTARRPAMLNRLVEFAERSGVPVVWGHKLETLVQHDDSVTVTFSNGVQETFSFVVGCDGLHSNTRTCLFGEQPATYTGLSQWGGVSPKPKSMSGKAANFDVFGNGCGMVIISVDDEEVIWAITVREPESKETWRAIDAAASEEFKHSEYSKWSYGAGEVVRNSTRILRYGLYDRPELSCWHKGRVVLIGDAAHPTSPHLGQGANQSYEDVGALIQLLEKYNPTAEPPSTETLEAVFDELEAVRVATSSAMVQNARTQGEYRVKTGTEECIARNNYYRKIIGSEEFYKFRFGGAK
ncbi:hypothetical protein PHLGIDRAFT_131362 [Phlebiopsis gigantea 11061_1 CR5-6]|uniref:FAD-binding domain-containing protein n=1 Tax=Phlebiopsis gigantea (strain 11061_1 CR5-6) TaxID=745531 RepID=A0A0C3S142_PHLG1|nr:hypothetical protein PHLGIDRAFT_131362 [Phlebiopsis gigantea 11061_1 CR5-6]